jgi:hypothetical protein
MIRTPAQPHGLYSPEELAGAIREGLESRRVFRKVAAPPVELPTPAAGGLLPQLLEVGGILGYPAPRTGPLTGWVRLVRRVVRRLANPWLERQTRFNYLTYELLHVVHHQVALLTDRVNALQRTVAGEVLPGYQATNGRLNDCLHDLDHLRRLLAGLGPTPPFDPVDTIEALFLHTRLPSPPARVLVCSPVGGHALDLASLGFQVTVAGCESLGHHHGLRVERGGPFADGSFDLAVALAGPTPDGLARVLAPGKRAIGSFRVDGEAPPSGAVADAIAPLRLVEVAAADRAGHGWELHPEPTVRCEVVLWVGANG